MKIKINPILCRLAGVLFCLTILTVPCRSQSLLTYDEIIVMLKDTKRVPDRNRRILGIIMLIEKYKVSAPLTREWEYKLIEAGATDRLISAAKDYAPSSSIKPISPALLVQLKKLLKYDEINETIPYSGVGQKFYYIKFGNKLGYIDRFGNEVVPPDYDETHFMIWGGGYYSMNVEQQNSTWYSSVRLGTKQGIIDLAKKGKISFLEEGIKKVEQCSENGFKTNLGLYSNDGIKLLSTKFKDYHCKFSDGLIAVSNGVKWGFADASENLKIQLEYDEVGDFSDGLAKVSVKADRGSKCGYIDKTGKQVIPIKYVGDNCGDFSGGKAIVSDGTAIASDEYRSEYNKLGVIDKNNRVIIPFKYAAIVLPPDNNIPETLLEVCSTYEEYGASDCGLIDWTGKEITPLAHDRTEYSGEVGFPSEPFWFKEGLAWVCKSVTSENHKCGVIDERGKVVIPFRYDPAKWIDRLGILTDDFHDGLARIVLNGKIGFVDKSAKETAVRYDAAYRFSEGLAKVCVDDLKDQDKYKKWICGFIDKTGKEITSLKYDNFGTPTGDDVTDRFNFGFAMVKVNDKYGFIDRNGREVIPVKYEDIWLRDTIQDGIVGVTLNGRKGFVDVFGNEYFD